MAPSRRILLLGAIALGLAAVNACGGGGDGGMTAAGGSGTSGVTASVSALSDGSGYSGWGATTPGGAGYPTVHVTNLNDSGSGSLRAALSAGNRYVVFDVGGTINLSSPLAVNGHFVTIDGSTAPAPGITLKNYELRILGVHDIILTNFRSRDIIAADSDNITIKNGAYNIVVDHVSTSSPTDGNIDVTRATDVTIQNSILSDGKKATLLNYSPSRVSIHHNLFQTPWRNPHVGWMDADIPNTTPPTDIIADIRNNIISKWNTGGGTILQCLGKANVINNYYWNGQAAQGNGAIVNDGCPNMGSQYGPTFYTSGNVSGDGASLGDSGNVATPLATAPVPTQSACDAARSVLQNAGARPLDSIDQALINEVPLPGCP